MIELSLSAELLQAIINADFCGLRSLSYRGEGGDRERCSVARRGSEDFVVGRSLRRWFGRMMTYLLPLLESVPGRPEQTDKSCSASLRFASQAPWLQDPTFLLGNSLTCKLVTRAVCLSHPSFSSSVAAVLILVSFRASGDFLI